MAALGSWPLARPDAVEEVPALQSELRAMPEKGPMRRLRETDLLVRNFIRLNTNSTFASFAVILRN